MVLHLVVQVFQHVLGQGRSEQAAITKSAGSEFGRSLKPGDDFPSFQKLCGLFDFPIVGIKPPVGGLAIVEHLLNLFVGIGGALIETGHWGDAWAVQYLVPHEPRGSE